MQDPSMRNYIKEVLKNMPLDWLNLTTHRLDIYVESLAKTQFLDQFEALYKNNNAETAALKRLPTAYDYIRLGHPLSSVLEWAIAKANNLNPENVISFASKTAPVLAILRKNLLANKNTQILYTDALPSFFDADIIRNVYNYNFELKQLDSTSTIPKFEGTTVFISQKDEIGRLDLNPNVDILINLYGTLGSIITVNGERNEDYISEIQHVRRRETIAMTPANCLVALKALMDQTAVAEPKSNVAEDKKSVLNSIKEITGSPTTPLVASSGLSIQYAIMMGLIHDAQKNHPGKPIKFLVPPNCYGGTNDQARRVAACLDNVEIVDLLVDGDNDMVQSIDTVLTEVVKEDAVPYIIAEIPTNPRVEVPNLQQLKAVLSKERKTANGTTAID
ncbi:MAG TPA: cystathionine beta-synthase, partial [Aequorivita sp.]|nr:cystathionine beta-synthase [Aequorivita sp.]